MTIEAEIEGYSCEPRISRDQWHPQKLEGARTHPVKSQREPGPADTLNSGLQLQENTLGLSQASQFGVRIALGH